MCWAGTSSIVTREERESFLESLIRESELVEITDEVQACRDPKERLSPQPDPKHVLQIRRVWDFLGLGVT